MQLDNTWLYQRSPFGMSGMGDVQTGQPITIGDTTIDPAAITAGNSELLYLTNWWRGINGQAPLANSQYAPAVNVGLTAETQNLLILGAVGALAFFALRKKRR